VKLATEMASRPPWRAEKMLNAELERPIDALHWQGVSDSAVERQVKAFEAAIRTELWRIVLLPPSPDMRMTQSGHRPDLRRVSHNARNQFIELFVEFSGCLHQRRIVAYDH
jgi:hypothetical protein